VTNAEKYHFADFTLENYERLLRLAAQKYEFRCFNDFHLSDSFILWRHDVDFSMHRAVKLARIEAGIGLRTSYHILLHSEFYNALESEVTACVTELAGLGHEIGLHFSHHYYKVQDEDGLVKALLRDKRIMEDGLGLSPGCFSFHMPDNFALSFQDPEYAGMVNSYSAFLKNDVDYCSDSNGYWRFRRLEDVICMGPSKPRLQVLTHPELWQDTAMSPKERVWRCIEGRASRTRAWYTDILNKSGRNNID
jgi:hypothetical protein